MEYNSQREKLVLPEYGRNIQRMIQEALQIKDKEERNGAARVIVSVMAQTNPSQKDVDDFNHKLWDHLLFISDYKLDVDSPYERPERKPESFRPKKIPYPQKDIKFKHYGKNLEYFIDKAKSMDDPEMKDRFVEVLVNLMKRHYLTWNRDSVNDELIKEHLKSMSKGLLEFKESFRLSSTNEILGQQKKKPVQQNQAQQNLGGQNAKKAMKKKFVKFQGSNTSQGGNQPGQFHKKSSNQGNNNPKKY